MGARQPTRRLRLFAVAVLALPLAACTIPSEGGSTTGTAADAPPVTVTETATETEVEQQETTVTDTSTIAETTVTETATRWAIGDPAKATNPNEQLFGPYPKQGECEELAGTDCVERDDGWYLDLRDEADAEDDADEGGPDDEPASPSESETADDTD